MLCPHIPAFQLSIPHMSPWLRKCSLKKWNSQLVRPWEHLHTPSPGAASEPPTSLSISFPRSRLHSKNLKRKLTLKGGGILLAGTCSLYSKHCPRNRRVRPWPQCLHDAHGVTQATRLHTLDYSIGSRNSKLILVLVDPECSPIGSPRRAVKS